MTEIFSFIPTWQMGLLSCLKDIINDYYNRIITCRNEKKKKRIIRWYSSQLPSIPTSLELSIQCTWKVNVLNCYRAQFLWRESKMAVKSLWLPKSLWLFFFLLSCNLQMVPQNHLQILLLYGHAKILCLKTNIKPFENPCLGGDKNKEILL